MSLEKYVISGKIVIIGFLFTSLLFPWGIAFGQHHIEFTPSISARGVYVDNIYLDPFDEISDYITTVSPSMSFSLLSQKINLEFQYAPTFIWYDERDENDTTRHSATMSLEQNLTQYLRFDLTDTYLRSEEPIEETEGVVEVRKTREPYHRNYGKASFSYTFGQENVVSAGYRHSLLENEDETLNDGTIQNPFGSMTYWFNVKAGVELAYEYEKAKFTSDDNTPAGDDYSGYRSGIRYIHRFTSHTSGFIAYEFVTRDFEESFLASDDEDYDVQAGSMGFDRSFSPNLSLNISGGYFIAEYDQLDDVSGYTYNVLMSNQFERGNITLGGSGGWDAGYLEAQRRGLTRFWSANAGLNYQVFESLYFSAGGSFRHNKEEYEGREFDSWHGNCSLRWNFLRWLSLSLDYSYSQRDDDIDIDEYKVNRVMLSMTAGKLYRLD